MSDNVQTDKFMGLESKYSSLPLCQFVVVPVPFEKTVCYGHGTAKGPAATKTASEGYRTCDSELSIGGCYLCLSIGSHDCRVDLLESVYQINNLLISGLRFSGVILFAYPFGKNLLLIRFDCINKMPALPATFHS